MSLARSRTIQYIGILFTLGLIAAGYWYFSARASTTLNKTPTGSLTNGLVGYWTFDGADISGTTVTDRSGSGNNGTLTGGPSPAIGKLGQALDFDGSDDYVSIPDASVLDVGDTADLSLSGWFSRDSFTTDDTLLAKRNGQAAGDTGYVLYLDDTTDQLIFEVSDGTDEYSLASTTTFTAAGWHHYAITWDQDSAANSEIFIDGVANSATDTGTIGNIGDLSNALTLRTGAESDDGNPFDGRLDEVRVYNAVLTAEKVKNLYDLGSSDKVNSSASQSQGAGLDSGLAGYWKLDEGSGTSAADASGNGRTGTLNNGVTWTTGRIGGAVDLDGANDYISVTSPPTLGTSYTIAYWAKLDVVASTGVIVGYRSTTAGTPVYFQINADTSSTFVVRSSSGSGEGISTYTNGLSTTGVWYHVTGVRRGNTIQVYINGNPGTADLTSTFGAIAANSLLIGATNVGSSSPSFFFNGQIDEVRLYDRALSEDEITQLYHLSTPTGIDAGLKGYWTFNGADISGTSAYDRSGSGNNGTLTGGPSPAIGKLGQALDFDGLNDYIVVGDPSSLRDIEGQGGGGMSISVWINPRSNGGNGSGNGHIVGKNNNDSGPGSGDWGLSLGSSGNNINFGHSRATQPIAATISNVWTANQWTHVVVTFNGGTTASTAIQFYINGVLQTHAYDQDGSGSFASDSGLAFHIGGSGTSWQFDGKLDEVRVYNRILSADEAFALYNAGR
ncbi:MAG: LamG domain-containing protein [Candidatus Moraniibacteriota bacterium]|nr:MAG: LamG domain-containing protein [Candidatus Moranbacteria bacterium]